MLYQSDRFQNHDQSFDHKIGAATVLQFKWGHFNLRSWPGKSYFMLLSALWLDQMDDHVSWLRRYMLVYQIGLCMQTRTHQTGWLEYCPALRQGFDTCRDDVTNNILSDIGFCKALELCLRLLPFGLLFGALPCQSYGFMSSATHGRSGTNPHGHPQYPFCHWGHNLCGPFCHHGLGGAGEGFSLWSRESGSECVATHARYSNFDESYPPTFDGELVPFLVVKHFTET